MMSSKLRSDYLIERRKTNENVNQYYNFIHILLLEFKKHV